MELDLKFASLSRGTSDLHDRSHVSALDVHIVVAAIHASDRDVVEIAITVDLNCTYGLESVSLALSFSMDSVRALVKM